MAEMTPWTKRVGIVCLTALVCFSMYLGRPEFANLAMGGLLILIDPK